MAPSTTGRSGFLPTRGGPALVLGLVVATSIAAVIYSHESQVRDKAIMRMGVERDKERLRKGKLKQQQQQQQMNEQE